MSARMYDLSISTGEGGLIRLEQVAGSLEGPSIVELHPIQVRLIAEHACLTDNTPAWPPEFERRMLRLRKEAADLADLLGAIPSFPPQAGMTADEAAAHALWESISNLMEDFGIGDDNEREKNPAATQTKPSGFALSPPNRNQQGNLL